MYDEDKIQNALDAVFKKKEEPYRSVKDFLYQVRDAKRKLQGIEDRINLLQASMGVRGMTFEEHVSSGHDFSGSSVESTFIALSELEERRRKAEKNYRDALTQVTAVIARLAGEKQRTVLTAKYIDGLPWEEIAKRLNTNVRNVQKLHGRALPVIDTILREQAA